MDPQVTDKVETGLPPLERVSSPSDSDVPVSVRVSKYMRKVKREKGERRSPQRRHHRQSNDERNYTATKFVFALKHGKGFSHCDRYVVGASPPYTDEEITLLLSLQ